MCLHFSVILYCFKSSLGNRAEISIPQDVALGAEDY